jgi:hypothetical protein
VHAKPVCRKSFFFFLALFLVSAGAKAEAAFRVL